MEHRELYALLELPDEVVHALNTYGNSRDNTFRTTVQDLMEDIELTLQLDKSILAAVTEDTDGFKTLWEELNIAKDAYDEYVKKGIPTSVFVDTMKFCTRFLAEYHKTYGSYRFVWGWWFPRQLSLREYRIGALEYEFCENECISIHIPSDADFSEQSVLQSLSGFQDFCRQYYPERITWKMECSSWLLSPALRNILPKGSHILAFQNRFDITETDYESMKVLDWVFPGHETVSEALPETTSLQKKMKEYLLEGNSIGWARGTLLRRPD